MRVVSGALMRATRSNERSRARVRLLARTLFCKKMFVFTQHRISLSAPTTVAISLDCLPIQGVNSAGAAPIPAANATSSFPCSSHHGHRYSFATYLNIRPPAAAAAALVASPAAAAATTLLTTFPFLPFLLLLLLFASFDGVKTLTKRCPPPPLPPPPPPPPYPSRHPWPPPPSPPPSPSCSTATRIQSNVEAKLKAIDNVLLSSA